MGILELPDKEFLSAYLKIIEVRFPTKSEKRRYENIQRHRPRISKADHDHMMARLDKFDKKVRIKSRKNQRIKDEGNTIDWQNITERVFESKQDFQVPLLVDGEEKRWLVTAFSMKEAQNSALQSAYDTGASFVSLIR
jgi:hypothetical protein